MTRVDSWTRGLGYSLLLWAAPALAAQPPAALPAAFEPNAGQTDPSVRYLLRAQQGTFFFTPSEVVFAPSASGASPLRVRFLGANPAPRFETGAPRVATVNYLLGADPRKWRTGLPTYSEIRYEELYPGVALAYGAGGGPLKGTYTVAPGTDPQRIRWRYQDGDASVDEAGRLQVRMGNGAATLTEHAPIAWQEHGGQRVPVVARYALAADGSVGFALGEYDRARPLTIDPVIEYSTFLGGGIFDIAWDLAVDAHGNAYIAGYTASSDFPTLGGIQPSAPGQGDGFVAKFAPDGTPVYITYLGGSYLDWATGIAIDALGNAYVTGTTGSVDFPTTAAFQPAYAGGWDAFAVKLSPSGAALLYSTYLGGSGQENYINAGSPGAITVDKAGCAYITGNTQSADYPTHLPVQAALHGSVDAFLTKLSADGGALVYSTFLGGSFGGETGWAVAVDDAGQAILTGDTTSSDFPTANALQSQCAPSFAGCWDVFVTKFNAAGSALVYSTYLGGNDQEWIDRGMGIAIDAAGTAYITGMTGSPDFPMLNPYQGVYGGQIDAFVARIGSGGNLLSSTFLGGNNSEVGYSIALDSWPFRPASAPPVGVHVSGVTISQNFPVVNPIQANLGGFEDGFVAKFTPAVNGIFYATYLGGTNGREEYGTTAIGVDARGNVYVTGGSEATDYPTMNPYQPTPHGSYDAVLTRIGPGPLAVDGDGEPSPVEPLLDPPVRHQPHQGHEDVDRVREPLLHEGQGDGRGVEHQR